MSRATATALRMCGLAALVLLAAAACAKAPRGRPVKEGPVDTGAGTLTSARKFLEGKWTLMSYEIFLPGEPSIVVDGTGVLTYDDFGNLTMDVRIPEATVTKLERAGVQTPGTALSTSGRTSIDLQNHTLTYTLEGNPRGSTSGPFALRRPRHWEVAGNVLTLTTKGDDGKPLGISKWQKEPASRE